MGASKKDPLATGPSVLSTSASDITESKLSVLSAATKSPSYSWGASDRFSWQRTERAAFSAAEESPPDTTSVERPHTNDVDANDVAAFLTGLESQELSAQETLVTGGHGISKPSWSNVTRFDGSADRFMPPRSHAGSPSGRFAKYRPAATFGEGTSSALCKSPLFSMGGGKSRMADLEKPEEATTGKSPGKKKSRSQSLTDDMTPRRQSKRLQLSRGFGSQARCQLRGGPVELPISPGPAQYEMARAGDEAPSWHASSLKPWGRRTGRRSDLKLRTYTDAGPGEYTADHPFKASGPSPKLGQKLEGLTDLKKHWPSPATYTVPDTVGDGPKFSLAAKGPSMYRINSNPGPGTYDLGSTVAEGRSAIFLQSERAQASDGVDPDEPPGPGAHSVDYTGADRKAISGWGKDIKLKKFPGMGPIGHPAPHDYIPNIPTLGKPISLALPLQKHVEHIPGAGTYDPEFILTWHADGNCSTIGNKAVRKSVFDMSGSSTEASSAVLLKRALKALAESSPPVDQNKVDGSTLGGHSFTMGGKRVVPGLGSRDPRDSSAAPLTRSFSSFG